MCVRLCVRIECKQDSFCLFVCEYAEENGDIVSVIIVIIMQVLSFGFLCLGPILRSRWTENGNRRVAVVGLSIQSSAEWMKSVNGFVLSVQRKCILLGLKRWHFWCVSFGNIGAVGQCERVQHRYRPQQDTKLSRGVRVLCRQNNEFVDAEAAVLVRCRPRNVIS